MPATHRKYYRIHRRTSDGTSAGFCFFRNKTYASEWRQVMILEGFTLTEPAELFLVMPTTDGIAAALNEHAATAAELAGFDSTAIRFREWEASLKLRRLKQEAKEKP